MPWWRFWKPETEDEQRIKQQQLDAVTALENGDIPPIAKERIQRQLASKEHLFSSDLSVNEFLLAKEAGIEIISQVMGTCFYNVSFFGASFGGMRLTGEMKQLTDARSRVRKLAIERMKVEAKLLGASGVIGVRVISKRPDLSSRSTEFTAYGTAVRLPEHPAGAEPFTSSINGQDFWQLYKAGYRPRGVVMGNCSYYIYTDWRTSRQMGLFAKNQEMDKYVGGATEARKLATHRLELELSEMSADGAVGMTIDYDFEPVILSENSFDMLVHFSAIGTGVVAGPPLARTSPLICIDLSKGKNDGARVSIG